MDILFDVDKQFVNYKNYCVASNGIVADSKNYLRAVFMFTPDWDGLIKTAIFAGGGNYYEVILVDNACMVPAEVIKPPKFTVSVAGVSYTGNQLITTSSLAVNITYSGYHEGITPADPTPDVYAQIIAIMQQQASDVEACILTTTAISLTITATARDGNTAYQCATRADIASIPATAVTGDTAIVIADWSAWQKNDDSWEEIII